MAAALPSDPVFLPVAGPPFTVPVLSLKAPLADGVFQFGGAVRTRGDVKFNVVNSVGKQQVTTRAGFDTLSLRPKYDSSTIFGAAEYRFYGGSAPYTYSNGYAHGFGSVSFLRYAYVGDKITKNDTLTFGFQQVPFGLLSYWGTSFNESLGFVMGLEDVYDVGVKYAHIDDNTNYEFAYLPVTGGNYFGVSKDSSRYSANIVQASTSLSGGTNNQERNILVARVEHLFYKNNGFEALAGASVWHSSIYNFDTVQTGSKQVEALHVIAKYNKLTLKAIASRLDINPVNPRGLNQTVTLGQYDSSYNAATKGYVASLDLSYKYDHPLAYIFSSATPYINYSTFLKDDHAFRNTERYILGAYLPVSIVQGLVIQTELLIGRNDPYVGSGEFSQGLAAGGTNNNWKKTYYTNIGYYF